MAETIINIDGNCLTHAEHNFSFMMHLDWYNDWFEGWYATCGFLSWYSHLIVLIRDELFQSQVVFLGCVVKDGHIEMDRDSVSVVKDWAIPRSTKDVETLTKKYICCEMVLSLPPIPSKHIVCKMADKRVCRSLQKSANWMQNEKTLISCAANSQQIKLMQ